MPPFDNLKSQKDRKANGRNSTICPTMTFQYRVVLC